MRAINFYSANYHSQLVCRRKNCTIRLGDKSNKYTVGDIVWIIVGRRFSPRKKIYAAIIDQVLVKPMAALHSDDLRGENPDIQNIDEMLTFLESVYSKKLNHNETVTVIYFSEILS